MSSAMIGHHDVVPLRERNRQRTRQSLCDAAVAILADQGIEAVTAEAVADRAGVSRRTFYNYFPRVENVLTANIEQATAATLERFVVRPADEPVRDSVLAVLRDLLTDPVFDQSRMMERAASASEAMRRFEREFLDSQTDALVDGLWRRLGSDADPVYVTALAAATAMIVSRITRLSEAEDEGVDPSQAAQNHRARLLRAFDLLFSGFDESAAMAVPRDPETGGN